MKTIPAIPHSPWPWRHMGASVMNDHDLAIGNTYPFICVQEGVPDPKNGGKVSQQANADLIVVAPAMYAALIEIYALTSKIAEDGSLAHKVAKLASGAFDALRDSEESDA